ncbi:MAG: hypothetical protein ABI658_26755 [Acidimicrobiales bacterium]
MAWIVFWGVVSIRFVLPLLVFRFPLPAIIACLIIDAADQTIFHAISGAPLSGYQTYDKALDIHYLTIAYFSTMRNWRHEYAFRWSRFLFVYRLVGVFLFELLDRRWVLFVFPNTFEFAFVAFEGIRTRWDPVRLSRRAIVWSVATIWVLIKLPQEWWIHVAQLDLTDVLVERPVVWTVVAGVVVAPLGGLMIFRNRLPTANWPLTFDVDRHQRSPAAGAVADEGFFSAVLIEKLVLLALVIDIFANALPDVEARDARLLVGVSLLVLLNAAITQLLRRRGHTWSTVLREFLAVLTINIAVVTIDAAVGTRRVAHLPGQDTLFFVVLLSALIALFDRYRLRRRAALQISIGSWRAQRLPEIRRRISTSRPRNLRAADATCIRRAIGSPTTVAALRSI